MTVRPSRNWLSAVRGLLLPAAVFVLAPTARAQTAPVPPTSPPSAAVPNAPASTPGSAPAPTSVSTPAPAVAAPAQPNVPAPAPAPPVPSEPSPALAVEPVLPPDEPKKKKKDKKNDTAPTTGVMTAAGRIQLKGRVFARAELQHRERRVFTLVGEDTVSSLEGIDSLDFSLASARVGLEYEAPLRWISAEAELELTGNNPSLKDGYVQARGEHFFARMGQFKLPTSALELESPWTLPLARRGFINDLLTDWLDVAGRRPGLMVGWRARGGLRPRFMVGAFQGTTLAEIPSNGDRDVDLLEKTSLDAQSYVARAQFEPADVQLGVWYQHRVGSRATNETKHYFTAGADALMDRVLAGGGIRFWVTGSTGASWYEHTLKTPDDKDAIFVEGRALVGYRFGGMVDEAPFVEPFGYFGVLEPDTDTRRDLAFEGAVGVNAGYWRRARLTLQGEINSVQRNFPTSYLVGVEPDRLGLLLQAGVAW